MTGRSLLLLLVALSTSACSRDDGDGDGETRPIKVGEDGAAASARRALITFRPLLDEAARAELDAGGLFVDLGTADQHKYTRGGWRSGWGPLRESGSAGEQLTFVEMTGRRAWLDLPARAERPRMIRVRARSAVPGQILTLHAGKRVVGVVPLAAAWLSVRVEVAPDRWPEGPVKLELRAGRSSARGPQAEVDWLWLGAAPAAEAPAPTPRVGPLAVGETVRRSILSPSPRTWSFYLQPPPGAHLVADLGAAGRATFRVSATADGEQPVELLRETVAGAWREGSVSLDRFAGKAIRLDLATSDQEGEAGWGEPEIAVAPASPAAARPPAPAIGPPPKNLVVILIDTARADAFGPFGSADRVARTPRYDQLAAESTVFARAYNNENWTKPSVATVLSGLYPSTHDTKKDPSVLPAEVELLSERLQQDGFATGGFIANGFISGKFGFDQGWDRYRNYIREGRPSEAEHVYRDALAWLEETAAGSPGKPFFLYIQAIDPHVTYEVAEPYWRPYFDGTYRGALGRSVSAAEQVALSKKKMPADQKNVSWLRALYRGEVAYHDEHMGRFIDELDRRGLRKNTLLVVTNDHGEELGERGRFGHGHQVYEEMVRAPLLLSYPPLFPAGARIDHIVEHVDLAPTLLDALGRDPLARADGESLLPVIRGEPARRPGYAIIEFLDGRRVVRVGSYKLTAAAGAAGELYDLAGDPGEREDLGTTRPIARRLCQVHLGEGLAVPDKAARMRGVAGRAGFRAGNAVIDPAVRRQLEALGYLGAGPEPAAEGTKVRHETRAD